MKSNKISYAAGINATIEKIGLVNLRDRVMYVSNQKQVIVSLRKIIQT